MSFRDDYAEINDILDDFELAHSDVNIEVGALESFANIDLPLLLANYDYQASDEIIGSPIKESMAWSFTFIDNRNDFLETNDKLETMIGLLNNHRKTVMLISKVETMVGSTPVIGWEMNIV